MARPSKSSKVIKLEKKSHRTKKEIAHRERQERASVSGIAIKEDAKVKSNPIAHRTFLKLKKILKAIEKDDAIYEAQINRYCLITAEIDDIARDRSRLEGLAEDLEAHSDGMQHTDYIKASLEISKQKISLDRELRAKRQQLFGLEKENCMTISGALRIIQKAPETNTNALKEALSG